MSCSEKNLFSKKKSTHENKKVEDAFEDTLVLKHNSTACVWNNEFESKKEDDPLSRIAYETMDTIIDFLYKLDQQQSKTEEKKGDDENFSYLKVTEKNVEQLLLASDLLIISKVEENCLRFQGGSHQNKICN